MRSDGFHALASTRWLSEAEVIASMHGGFDYAQPPWFVQRWFRPIPKNPEPSRYRYALTKQAIQEPRTENREPRTNHQSPITDHRSPITNPQ
jgi:hypothetical protein